MSNELQLAFNEITQLRELSTDVVLEALQSALVSAYRKDSGASAAQAIEAKIDPKTGRAFVYVEKEVVDDVESDATEVTLETARYYEPEAQIHDVVMVQVENTTKSFGRIAAQTAKQVILQKIREAERSALYDEFINREGDLITGTVQSVNSRQITLSLGRAEADLIRSQQIPGERYRTHEKIRVYVLEVKKSSRGPQIIVSRAHRNMLRRLLEYEVPEIYNGQVEIKNIAREAGHRSKVAVAALQDGIDPVGACVGMRGIRIQNIVKELHNEKIDVIEWNSDAKAFISKALSPARVTGVYLDDDPLDGRTAVVLVPDDQLSLAIGREGQNARLAAKLTGWRIDIKSVAETVQNTLAALDAAQTAQAVLNALDALDAAQTEADQLDAIATLTALGAIDAPEDPDALAADETMQSARADAQAAEGMLDALAALGAAETEEEAREALTALDALGAIDPAVAAMENPLDALKEIDASAIMQSAGAAFAALSALEELAAQSEASAPAADAAEIVQDALAAFDASAVKERAREDIDKAALFQDMAEAHKDLIAEAHRIMDKRRAQLTVMPEEYKSLGRLADLIEQRLMGQRLEIRERYLQERAAVKDTLPAEMFELPLDVLAVSQAILDAIEPYSDIGGVMLDCLMDEALIARRLASIEGEPMSELRAALDVIMSSDLKQLLAEAISIEESAEDAEAEAGAEDSADAPAADGAAAESAEAAPDADSADEQEAAEEDEVLLDAFGQPIVDDEPEEAPAPAALDAAAVVDAPKPAVKDSPRDDFFRDEEQEAEFELERSKGKQQRRKDRQKRRQLVLDEASGEVIAKRRRKGRRGSWDEETWEDYEY